MKFKHALATDIGNYRKMNQDNLAFVEKKTGEAFGIVCDGMGGHAHGEIASKIAVDTFIALFKKQDFSGFSNKEINRWLRGSINEILDEMIEHATNDESTWDMGTTLTAILFVQEKAFVVNVGDSRTYKVINNSLYQITMDQNLWNSTPDEEKKDIQMSQAYGRYQNELTFWKVLTSALGPKKTLKIDTYLVDETKGTYFLTSDGVHDYIQEPIVVATLKNEKIKLKEKAQMIIEDAKDNMSTDNLSILIIEAE
jgi:serine/threonine protein phosphatase PrpC